MITIIRYRNDTYTAAQGTLNHPIRRYSGFIGENQELAITYSRLRAEFVETLENAVSLDVKVAKELLTSEIPDWNEKQKRELAYVKNNKSRVPVDSLWKQDYTLYHLDLDLKEIVN